MTNGLKPLVVVVAVALLGFGIALFNAQTEKAIRVAAAKVAAEKRAAFERLSPAEHLAEAKKLLRVDGQEASISEGLNHIAAIDKTSAIYKQADQARRAFQEAKTKHDAEEVKTRALAEAVAKRLLRVELAKTIENKMLDEGLNVEVSAIGSDQTVLRIKWILVSKVVAHQLAKEAGFFSNARELGFKRIEITDGYDETWWWKLN
jgi:phosphosulfolactate synthase (CoM biosynthesis protein A)